MKRVCSEERFGFYFQLGIPEGGVSEVEVTSLVASLGNADGFKESVLTFKKAGRLRPLLEKLLDQIERLNEDQIKNLLILLWQMEKDIDEERNEVFDLDSVERSILRLAFNGLKKVEPTRRLQMLELVLKEVSSIFYPANFIAYLSSEKNTEPLLDTSALDGLKKDMLQRIESARKNGSLLDETHLFYFLILWRDWGDLPELKTYIKSLTENKENLLKLLRAFVSKVLSTGGNYFEFDLVNLNKLIDSNTVKEKIALLSEEERTKLGDKDKEAIDLFCQAMEKAMPKD